MTNRHAPQRVVLIGMPGSGKTAVARLLARRFGRPWDYADTDDMIVATDGRTIPQIFEDSGEETFRKLERQAIAETVRSRSIVISTGGGAVLEPQNRQSLWRDALVVFLKARPETLASRVAGAGMRSTETRPLLAGKEPAIRLRVLTAQRTPLYELADWTIQTDALYPDQVADEILRVHQRLGEQLVARAGRAAAWMEAGDENGAAAWVRTSGGSYPVYTGPGELRRLGERMGAAGLNGRATVVSDATVAALYGEAALSSLVGAGFDAELVSIPGGEDTKHMQTVLGVFDRLIARRCERGDPIVALGGGVCTDLAGFVAATYLRGVPLVHAPTSLLGMADAAIGGKVGVDHAEGKNLIGAFYQPRLVLADTDTLETLPPRELTEGWAEVIKHALILDPELLQTLERDAELAVKLDPDVTVAILRRSARLKAKIVSGDEREEGARITLNYGHTIGHALEAATGYSAVLHGEGVAVGMQGAAAIAVHMGTLAADVAERQTRILGRYGLPLRWPGADFDAVMQALKLDKKVAARRQRWVLLAAVGRTVVRDDVPDELVREVVAALLLP